MGKKLFGTTKKAQKFIGLNRASDLECSCGEPVDEYTRDEHEEKDHVVISKHDAEMLKELEFDAYSNGDLTL